MLPCRQTSIAKDLEVTFDLSLAMLRLQRDIKVLLPQQRSEAVLYPTATIIDSMTTVKTTAKADTRFLVR